MKKINHLYMSLVALALMVMGVSCNYLDIVPDETPTESEAFRNKKAAERYLYTCYGFIPRPSAATGSIDFLTGDEIVSSFEHETFANFPKGTYNARNPQISYWNTLFSGIRYCYSLIDNVDAVPGIEPEVAADYKAQAEFLIGFYHYLLVQNYGPTIIITGVEDTNAPAESFKPRSPLDECVKFIVDKLDSSAAKLPQLREGNEYGLATSVAAKAIKAKLLVLVASPLFNGNAGMYSDFKNPDGTQLIPTVYDQSKWTAALAACKEAVNAAEASGNKLYKALEGALNNVPEPVNMVQRSLRFAIIDKESTHEIVWGDTRGQGYYDIMPKSVPYAQGKPAWSGIAPTLAMMKRFYTENGLPIDEDPAFPAESQWWDLMNVPEGYENADANTRIPRFVYKREPRLYAWTSFQNGFFEIAGAGNIANSSYDKKYARGEKNGKVVMKMMVGEPSGRGASILTLRKNNYLPSGFINKKLVHPSKTPDQYMIHYIHPYVLLSDLYLLLAEAAVECNDLPLAKEYTNKIRERAGIPDIDTSWANAKHPGKANSKEGMREIVRQERMIELYLCNQNFWDLRRWLIAEHYFGNRPQGMNIVATTLEDFTRVVTIDVTRQFDRERNYLMPIPAEDVDNNVNLVQNPGY